MSRVEEAMAKESAIIVGRSELADFRQCPLKRHFRYVLGYYPPNTLNDHSKSSDGTLYHLVLQSHYEAIKLGIRDLPDLIDIGAKRIAALAESLELDTESVAQLEWMHAGYLERYGADDDWDVVSTEQTVFSWIRDPYSRQRSRFQLRWTADLVVRVKSLGDRIAIVDNKTTGSQGTYTTGDIDIDDQLGLYQVAWRNNYPADPPIYGVLNQIRRDKLKRPMTLTERVRRLRSVRTLREQRVIEADAFDDMVRMYSPENVRRPTSHPDPRTCSWKCDFKEAHIAYRRSGGNMDEAEHVIVSAGYVNDPKGDPALGRLKISP